MKNVILSLVKQGKYTEANFIKPYQAILDNWLQNQNQAA